MSGARRYLDSSPAPYLQSVSLQRNNSPGQSQSRQIAGVPDMRCEDAEASERASDPLPSRRPGRARYAASLSKCHFTLKDEIFQLK